MSKREPAEYWRDDRHDALRITLIDSAGSAMIETGPVVMAAPLNANALAPVHLRVELLHEDGCAQVLDEWPLSNY